MIPYNTCTGILTVENNRVFLLGENGEQHFADAAVWNGYTRHWCNHRLDGILLPQNDYITGKPITLLWPHCKPEQEPFIELYYNERLVRYFYSFLGHIAINVNGEIFNFSHLLNECEVMSVAEYFYRPALGMFGPGPGAGYNIDDPAHPYLDKFGRQFMRTIHVARITGLKTEMLPASLHRELEIIHSTPEDPHKPGIYRDFSMFTRSCTTIIRDALHKNGFRRVKGVFPRDLFASAVWNLYRLEKQGLLKLSVFTRPQLFVDEAPLSRISPLFNPANKLRARLLRRKGIDV